MASNLRVDQITASTTGSVSIGTATFTGGLSGNITGLNVTGVITATTLNQNVTGVVTATGGFVVGTGATISGSTNTITASTNGSERLRITSGGNVGIGTDNPYANAGTNLHIHSANTTSEIRLTNSTTGGGLNGSIVQQGGNTLYISNSESGNTVFENAGSERARVTSTGNVQIANGNLVFSTSGTGIDFSANANATGMSSELLDDYEEGTFTVTALVPNSSGTITLDSSNDTLWYTKIGRLVTIGGKLNISSVSSPSGFYVELQGLPFVVSNTSALENYSSGTAVVRIDGTPDTGQIVRFVEVPSNNNTKAFVLTNCNNFAANRSLDLAFFYWTPV